MADSWECYQVFFPLQMEDKNFRSWQYLMSLEGSKAALAPFLPPGGLGFYVSVFLTSWGQGPSLIRPCTPTVLWHIVVVQKCLLNHLIVLLKYHPILALKLAGISVSWAVPWVALIWSFSTVYLFLYSFQILRNFRCPLSLYHHFPSFNISSWHVTSPLFAAYFPLISF